MDEEEDELYPLFAPDVPILGHGYEEGVLAYSPACSIERLVDEPSLTIPGRRLFSQLDELRTEVQRRDQELLGMSAKMKTLEEQHQDYQRHIAVLKESLCAKEEHYNMLQADVSPKRLCRRPRGSALLSSSGRNVFRYETIKQPRTIACSALDAAICVPYARSISKKARGYKIVLSRLYFKNSPATATLLNGHYF